jgi:hypothetical protein
MRNLREFSMADPQVMTYPQVAPLRTTALAVLQCVAADSLRSLDITLESASPIHMMHLSNLGNLRELRLTFWEPYEGPGPESRTLAALPPWKFVNLVIMDWCMENVEPAHIDAYLDFLCRCKFQSISSFALRLLEPHSTHAPLASNGLRLFFEHHTSIAHSTLDIPLESETVAALLPHFTSHRLRLCNLRDTPPTLIADRVVELELEVDLDYTAAAAVWLFLDELLKVTSRSHALRLLVPVFFGRPRFSWSWASTSTEFAEFICKLAGYVGRLEERGIHVEDEQGVRLAG